MGWSNPSNNTGILAPNGETTWFVTGVGRHDIIVVEPALGAGSVEVIRINNEGGGRYRVTIRKSGNVLVRFHGESVN